ncbi:beta-lactamase family protein [Halobacteria archaeon AArc-curdl1]|uniref:Beta-lactamase family protein n=1 Tax=Natronosalvus hydrolyticus TaxID=2979988 RepID=A0AAP3E7T1_9EURY|nr:beta-lactamase family protein [Halobacteria archaeon AArc-curdl1]
MEPAEAKSKIENRLRTTVDDTPAFDNAFFLIHSESRDVHWDLAYGQVGETPAEPNQPYHAASVGKAFTSTIIAMLVEEGELQFDDPVTSYLADEVLDGLHVYRGTDYTDDIRIHHLLSHTSGLPHLLSDDFGLLNRRKEQSPEGKTFLDVMVDDPDRFWEPEETIEWAKENLHPHFRPGDGIYYSEVGYNLLGLVIESVTSRPYHEALHDYLFEPLSMNHSYLAQFSEPAVEPDRSVPRLQWEDETFDVEEYRSFSGWYAGGQTVNTAEDLFTFHRALIEGNLVGKETLEEMTQWRRLSIGLDYGYGVARFRPIPLLSKYRAWGGIGSTNSFMFYSPGTDVYLIGTFNQTASRSTAYRFAFRAIRAASKVESST